MSERMEQPTFQSTIEGFVPDWIWERADAGNLVITLHMIKDGAMAGRFRRRSQVLNETEV